MPRQKPCSSAWHRPGSKLRQHQLSQFIRLIDNNHINHIVHGDTIVIVDISVNKRGVAIAGSVL